MNRKYRMLPSKLAVIIPFLLTMATVAISQTDIPAGEVKGTWTLADSPYFIHGEIIIPNGATLEIEPGVRVIFTGHFKLIVQGRIVAIGTGEAMIDFTAQDTVQGWHGIRFHETNPANDSSKIVFCKLCRGKAVGDSHDDRCGGAIFIKNFDKVIIAHCVIMNNETNGDQFTGGGGIFLDSSSPQIVGNLFSGNNAIGGHGGGICMFYKESDPVIVNNTLCNNQAYGGGGLAGYLCNPFIINNTIADNGICDHGGGVDFIDSSPTFINTILFGNKAGTGDQVHVGTYNGPTSEPNFLYCDIEGGKNAFARDHSPGGVFKGRYENIINQDPKFINTARNDYQLSDASPCIGKGTSTIHAGNRVMAVLQTDFAGNNRPEPADSKPDIGAFENELAHPSINIKEGV